MDKSKQQPFWKKRAKTVSVAIFNNKIVKDNITFFRKNIVLQLGHKKKDSEDYTNDKININNIHELERTILLLEEAKKVFLMDDAKEENE